MTGAQRWVIIFASLYVLGVASGLHGAALEAASLGLPLTLGVTGTFGGILYAIGKHNRSAGLAFALGGWCFGYALVCSELDTTAPNHLINFVREPGYRDEQDPPLYTEVYGCIAEDPDVRSGSTYLQIKPQFILELDAKRKPVRKVPIEKGGIQARADRQLSQDRGFQSISYGDLVMVRETELLMPPLPENPGSYNSRAYLRSIGVYASLELSEPIQLQRVEEKNARTIGLEPCAGRLQGFALWLRKKFTEAIKHTTPFPESSFMGGVMLGLRGGMETKPYRDLREPFMDPDLSPWQKLLRAFGSWSIEPGPIPTNAVAVYQATGTAHILAVSGLHVGIIAAGLFGLLSLLRVPKQLTALVIIFAVWIFALLVGFRPSVIRSATMMSIVAFSHGFWASSLRTGVLFGLSCAAILVMFFYPLAVTEASVTYSFGAILSLALLTNPFDHYLRRHVRGLTGYAMLVYVYIVLCLAAMGMLDEWPPHWTLWVGGLVLLSTRLASPHLPVDLSFDRLPSSVRAFLSAQLAILAGLVIPLNTYYFQQLPISSPLGNVIAIPGLTVVLFVGILSVLVFWIPFIGPFFSMLLMAGNWFYLKYLFFPPLVVLFWLIPWPAFWPPSLGELGFYYLLLGVLAWHNDIAHIGRKLTYRVLDLARAPRLARRLLIALALFVLAGLAILVNFLQKPPQDLRLHVFHPYSLTRGGGHPILIETSWGETVLVDGGPQTIPNSRNKRATVPFDAGERVVGPILLNFRIAHLDTVVVSNFRQSNLGGLLYILEHFSVERVVDPLGPELPVSTSYEDFLKALGDTDLLEHQMGNPVRGIYQTWLDYRQLCERRKIPILKAEPQMELLHPRRPAHDRWKVLLTLLFVGVGISFFTWFRYRQRLHLLRASDLLLVGVLFLGLAFVAFQGHELEPASLKVVTMPQPFQGPGALEANSLVLRLEAPSWSALLASDLQADDQERLLSQVPPEQLKADLLVIPDGAQPEALEESFIQAVSPKSAIAIQKKNRFNRTKLEQILDAYRKKGVRVYPTDECGGMFATPAQLQTVRPCAEPKT